MPRKEIRKTEEVVRGLRKVFFFVLKMGDRCATFRLVEKESGQKKLVALQKKEITGALVLETVRRQVFYKRDPSRKFGDLEIRK